MPDDDKPKSKGPQWAVMGGIALNVEYTRKYGFEATAAARVTAKIVAVPPPMAFQEAVLADAAGRAKRAAPKLPKPTPLPEVPQPDLSPRPPKRHHDPKDGEDEQVDEDDDDDDRFSTLELIIEDHPSTEYYFDDGVLPPSRGVTLDDGTLTHRVSRHSSYCSITFSDDEGSRLEFPVIHDDEEAFAAGEYDDDADLTADDDFDDDEWPVVTFLIEDQPNSPYTLDDGISEPSSGVTSDEGLLVHPVSPDSTACTIQFGDEFLIRFPVYTRA
ncbi:hypothetical protein [Methyloterricola oryzae]|uniref:hypothetical protein n=1 Tax=Methyloterricola oryzae TaxID=1495050 RepID=UPI0005EB0C3F|nr:hypothetical protein [Methyloterricola oryzae]